VELSQPSAQQLSAEQRNNLFKAQKVITDPAEYNAYLTAVITSDPAARIAALDAFLERFPNSAAQDDAMDRTMDAHVQLDNQNTALVRLHLRSMKLEPTPAATFSPTSVTGSGTATLNITAANNAQKRNTTLTITGTSGTTTHSITISLTIN
jgi:hypothetical protein